MKYKFWFKTFKSEQQCVRQESIFANDYQRDSYNKKHLMGGGGDDKDLLTTLKTINNLKYVEFKKFKNLKNFPKLI